ncbi:MAG TPA: fumarate hydratase [Clostridia bacterium]|jgi:fumarate hydratase subunit alpha|nr:fumarate hydratase [Clostridia bacterium]
MREVNVAEVAKAVEKLSIEANCCLPEDVLIGLQRAEAEEKSPLGKEILKQIIANAEIAQKEQMPICQDTGMSIVFLEIGQEIHFTGGYLYDAINEGIRKGYSKGFLRKSIVNHPFLRKNTNDNTPAIIHSEIVPGDKLKIVLMPKGAGSENMSRLAMLKPAEGKKGLVDFVRKAVEEAGANPCPPLIIGIGIGGNMEKTTLLAKKALLRPLNQPNRDGEIKALEKEILQTVNASGIGPQGFGGIITALAVHIEYYPTHIASLPVAVNLSCHATRHAECLL